MEEAGKAAADVAESDQRKIVGADTNGSSAGFEIVVTIVNSAREDTEDVAVRRLHRGQADHRAGP